MATPADQSPVTSYSDPIYDRLEGLAHAIRQRMALCIAVLVALVAVAVLVNRRLKDTPMAASAAAFVPAGEERDPAKLAAAYAKLADDPAITPLFRARACIELTQIALGAGKVDEAKAHVAKAAEQAGAIDSLDLNLAVQLSRAAVELQSGDAAKAEDTYSRVERSAGAKNPDRQLAATLGVVLAQEKQGKMDDAIAKLEPLVGRADAQARSLLDMARAKYWQLKRLQAEKAAAAADQKPAEAKPAAPAPAADAKPSSPAPAPAPAQ